MKFSEKKAKELFLEAWNDLTESESVEVYNIFARENYYEEIYENSDDLINELFRTPYEALCAGLYGSYTPSQKLCWFNGYANLESSDFLPPFVDENELATWYIDQHWDELPSVFCDFCEYMNAAGDEEDDDEESATIFC